MKTLHWLLLLAFLFTTTTIVAQIEIYSCSGTNTIKKITVDDNNNCTTENIGVPVANHFDIAWHPNGKLYTTDGDELFYIDFGSSTQVQVGTFQLPPGHFINALAADAQGNLYGASRVNIGFECNLYLIDTDGQTTLIGAMPYRTAGDLFFYNGELYLMADDPNTPLYDVQAVLVDLDSTQNSIALGNLPGSSYIGFGRGAATYQDSCENVRVFINTGPQMIGELDMETNTLSDLCSVATAVGGLTIPGDYQASECFTCENMTITPIIIPPSCPGASNGSIEIIAAGGAAPYSFVWSNGANGSLNDGLTQGGYSVEVMDAKGCTLSLFEMALVDPPPVEIWSDVTPVSCFGGNDGQAFAMVNNSLPYYSYTWSNGQVGNALIDVQAGTYLLTVIDTFGNCTSTLSVDIPQPDSITAMLSAVEDNGSCNGSAMASVSGGVPPYTYSWAPTGQTTATITDVCHGDYKVTITDANGCTIIEAIGVPLNVGTNQVTDFGFQIFPNPSSSRIIVKIVGSEGNETKLYLMDITGRTLLSRETNEKVIGLDLSVFSAGTLFLKMENDQQTIIKRLVKH